MSLLVFLNTHGLNLKKNSMWCEKFSCISQDGWLDDCKVFKLHEKEHVETTLIFHRSQNLALTIFTYFGMT